MALLGRARHRHAVLGDRRCSLRRADGAQDHAADRGRRGVRRVRRGGWRGRRRGRVGWRRGGQECRRGRPEIRDGCRVGHRGGRGRGDLGWCGRRRPLGDGGLTAITVLAGDGHGHHRDGHQEYGGSRCGDSRPRWPALVDPPPGRPPPTSREVGSSVGCRDRHLVGPVIGRGWVPAAIARLPPVVRWAAAVPPATGVHPPVDVRVSHPCVPLKDQVRRLRRRPAAWAGGGLANGSHAVTGNETPLDARFVNGRHGPRLQCSRRPSMTARLGHV